MNRIFHPKVGLSMFFIIFILALLLLYFFWVKEILLAVLFTLFILFWIEMIIHTEYVLTAEGVLKLRLGRFFPDRTIPVNEITRLERSNTWRVSAALARMGIRVFFKESGRLESVFVSPQNEKAFIEALIKQNSTIHVDSDLPRL